MNMATSEFDPVMRDALHKDMNSLEMIQRSFHDIIHSLEQAESEEEMLSLQEEAKILRSKSQEMIVLLRVMMKIRTELAYAKLDLEKAIKRSDQVDKAKRRVKWLENRLSRVLLKCKDLSDCGEEHIRHWTSQEPFARYISKPYQVIREELSRTCYAVDKTKMADAIAAKRSVEKKTAKALGTNKVSNKLESLKLVDSKRIDSKHDLSPSNGSMTIQGNAKQKKVSNVVGNMQLDQHLLHEEKSNIHQDAVDKYWESEHHRFETSNFMRQIDPISWHALPICYHDSFLEQRDPPLLEIPISERSSIKDIVEFQKKSFNKLLKKMELMYNALNDASEAQLSLQKVAQKQDDTRRIGFRTPRSPDVGRVTSPEKQTGTVLPTICNETAKVERAKMYPRSPLVWSETQQPVSSFLHKKKLQGAKHKIISPPPTKRRQSTMHNLWDKRKTMKRAAQKVRVIAKFRIARRRSSQMPDTDRLKWKRVVDLLGKEGVHSENDNIALDSIKCLGQLECDEESVLETLAAKAEERRSSLIGYEASKALLSLGAWDNIAVKILTSRLEKGDNDWKRDVLQVLKNAKEAQFVDQNDPDISHLCKILLQFVQKRDETLAFDAALALGHMCVVDADVKNYLLRRLNDGTSEVKAEALKTLVKQMNCKDNVIIEALLEQLTNAINWKHRVEAADLLIFIGHKSLIAACHVDRLFHLLEELLWNHPSKELRKKVARVIDELGLRSRARAIIAKRLEDVNETARAHAITAMATLGIKSEGQLRTLLDILELDPSLQVRTEVIQAFAHLDWTDDRVLLALEDKEKGDGPLAKEASKALKMLRRNIKAMEH